MLQYYNITTIKIKLTCIAPYSIIKLIIFRILDSFFFYNIYVVIGNQNHINTITIINEV